jgi:hypothetical protein
MAKLGFRDVLKLSESVARRPRGYDPCLGEPVKSRERVKLTSTINEMG